LRTLAAGKREPVGVGILFAILLGIIGLAALFVAPWIGAAFLFAAVVAAVTGVFWLGTRADDVAGDREGRPPEKPHMPGPPN
jgi:hypothetical protein